MGESLQHIKLVNTIKHRAEEIVQESFKGFILLDLPESKEKPPQMSEGFRPDLYYCHNGIMIIGEAKTSYDFEKRHSQEQYLSYMKACLRFKGTAIMIVAVPWTESRAAKNLLRRIKRKNSFDVHINVLDDVGQVGQV